MKNQVSQMSQETQVKCYSDPFSKNKAIKCSVFRLLFFFLGDVTPAIGQALACPVFASLLDGFVDVFVADWQPVMYRGRATRLPNSVHYMRRGIANIAVPLLKLLKG